jgi:hypothetical protein
MLLVLREIAVAERLLQVVCDLAAVHRLDRVGGPWDRVGGPSAQAEDIPVDRVA